MKKIKIYYLCAAVLTLLGSCKDDVVENLVVPAQTGDEIMFGSELTNMGTRTIYGDSPEGNAYPVYWEKGDEIAIYCPEAAQTKLVDYKITPAADNPKHSSLVEKVNSDEAGLQWGTEETHYFYGFYPASAVTGTEKGKIKGKIPVVQDPESWKLIVNEKGGKIYTGVANTDYAYMWAAGTAKKKDGKDVALTFHPWVTILDIEISGPSEGTMNVASVNIESTDGTILTGDFVCDMSQTTVDGSAPEYQPSGNTTDYTRNRITISCYNEIKTSDIEKGYISLGPNDKIVVRAYLLPTEYKTGTQANLRVRVTPQNSSTLTRTLNGGGNTDNYIKAHCVNKVVLPSIRNNGVNYWMNSLDNDIYISELSYPGSYRSAADVYQSQTLEDQLNNGIRAFYLQFSGSRQSIANAMEGQGDAGTCLDKIGTWLSAHPTEFAVVTLNYKEGGIGYDCDDWMIDVADLLEKKSDYIYDKAITSGTTINDVRGKMIVITRYNQNETYSDWGSYRMYEALAKDSKYPSLFAMWEGYTEDVNYAPMNWGTSNFSQSNDGYQNIKPAGFGLYLMYQDLTGVVSSGEGLQGTVADKEGQMEAVFNQSVTDYKSGLHDTWYYNDLGGYTDNDNKTGSSKHATHFNELATGFIQARTDNASLGIVLMNYVGVNTYKSADLTQTIIDNNFRFELRKASANQTANYNASYNKGGNAIGWN